MMTVSARRGTVPFCGYTAHEEDHVLPKRKTKGYNKDSVPYHPLLKRLTHYIPKGEC